jgi:hypothetical protein
MISLSSLLLAGVAAVLVVLPAATLGAICIGDYPVEGCGRMTFDNATCGSVLATTEFLSGSCCSVSDHGGGGCRISVDGPNSDCQVRLAGDPYPFMMVMSDRNNGTCPPSQYNVTTSGGDGGSEGAIAQCKKWNTTCSVDGGAADDACCDGLVCRQGSPANATRGALRCLNCKRENETCRAWRDCCKGTRCRRATSGSNKRTCRACVRVNKPCLDDGDCCYGKARCRAKSAGSAEMVCTIRSTARK